MKTFTQATLAILILSFFAQGVQAQAAGPGSAQTKCILFDTVNPVGGAVLGQIRFCLFYDNPVATSTSNIPIGASLLTPVYFPLLPTIATSFTFVSLTGCATSGAATTYSNVGTGAAIGFEISTMQRVLLSSGECSGWVEAKVSTVTPAVTYFDHAIPFSFQAADAPRNQIEVQCGSTSTVNAAPTYISPCAAPTIDNQNRLCNASAFGATCTTPLINVAQSGTWTLDNTNRFCAASALGTSCTTPTINLGGTVAVTQSGSWQIDNQNRFCASSSFGTSCTTPSITVVPGGVQHIVLDSLPTLSVAQSGTWSIDNQNRLCNASSFGTACTTPTINAAITGTLTVTNTGSQSITVSGTLDNLNRICAASTLGSTCTVATINTNTISTIMGNSTQTVNFPGNLTIDLHSRGGIGNANGPGYDWWLELAFWILVFWYIMRNQNLFMLVFALGGVLHLFNSTWFFGLATSIPWLMLGALTDLFLQNRRRRKAEKKPTGGMSG